LAERKRVWVREGRIKILDGIWWRWDKEKEILIEREET